MDSPRTRPTSNGFRVQIDAPDGIADTLGLEGHEPDEAWLERFVVEMRVKLDELYAVQRRLAEAIARAWEIRERLREARRRAAGR
jgi:hypothetical protein